MLFRGIRCAASTRRLHKSWVPGECTGEPTSPSAPHGRGLRVAWSHELGCQMIPWVEAMGGCLWPRMLQTPVRQGVKTLFLDCHRLVGNLPYRLPRLVFIEGDGQWRWPAQRLKLTALKAGECVPPPKCAVVTLLFNGNINKSFCDSIRRVSFPTLRGDGIEPN